MPDFIQFDDVSRHHGSVRAVDGVTLGIRKGEFYSLLGPSGCGKTTLLRMLAGFERPGDGAGVQVIDFLQDPEVAAENSEAIGHLCPDAAAYPKLPASFRDNPAILLVPDVRAKCETIRDLGADDAKYTRVWDEIKAAN